MSWMDDLAPLLYGEETLATPATPATQPEPEPESSQCSQNSHPLPPPPANEESPSCSQSSQCSQGAESHPTPLADFFNAWQGWVGDQAAGARELVVAMNCGFAPRRFREAAEALFGELPETPYALGGYLATYRGLGAAGLRLEDETVTNEAGERVRRYRVVESG